MWISDGVNSLLRVRTDGQQERVRDGNFYNAVFLPGAADAMLLSIHYPAVVVRWSPNGPQIPLDIRFDPGEHPSALAVAPADWRGGSGFQPGDLLLTTGSDKEPEHIWRLRDGVPPLELEPKNGVPAGFFDAAFSRDAIYLTHTGGFKGHPEDDAILRLNADTIQPVQITPPLSELVPGTRGAMSIACDRATGDLFVAIPSLDAKNIDHPVRLLHLRPVDGGAQKFTATIVTTPEIRRTARFALDLSPDARRLAVTDDNARRVFIFERK